MSNVHLQDNNNNSAVGFEIKRCERKPRNGENTKINGAHLRRQNIERKTDCGENQ